MPENEEQVKETSAQESTTETTATVEKKEAEPEKTFIAPTEEEFKKAIQSASSKAKYSLLQELGINSVDDFKQKAALYESAIKEVETLKQKQTSYETEVEGLKRNLVIEQLGVLDEYKDDLITLAQAKVDDKKDFKSSAEEILGKNPNWKKGQTVPKLGTEKSEVQVEPKDVLSKKYPWIK